MESPIAVANSFIKKSLESGIELTPMKLMKMVYIAHGWHLAIFDNELISEPVQAWKYGPVIVSVYNAFKIYGNGQIPSAETILESSGNFVVPEAKEPKSIAIIDKVWDTYSKFSGIDLSALTHLKGTPWDITWNDNNGKNQYAAIIPNSLIKDHYTSLKNARASTEQPNS